MSFRSPQSSKYLFHGDSVSCDNGLLTAGFKLGSSLLSLQCRSLSMSYRERSFVASASHSEHESSLSSGRIPIHRAHRMLRKPSRLRGCRQFRTFSFSDTSSWMSFRNRSRYDVLTCSFPFAAAILQASRLPFPGTGDAMVTG